MIVPVVFLVFIAAGKFDQSTNKLTVSKVVTVVKVEKDLVSTHELKVDEILNRDRLLVNSHWHFSLFDLDVLGT